MQLNDDEIKRYCEDYDLKPETIHKWHRLYVRYCTSTGKSNLNTHVRKMSGFEEFISWMKKRAVKQNRKMKTQKAFGLPVLRKTDLEQDLKVYEAALKNIEDDEKFVPDAETFYKFAVLFTSMPIEKLRAEVFNWVRADAWGKFIKMFFSFYHANPEQVAMDLRTIRERSSDSLKRQIQILEELQSKESNPDKIADMAKVIGQLTNQLSGISSQFAKDLSSLNLVGSKIKGGVNIQIINKIPRPNFHTFKQAEIKTIEGNEVVIDE